jgi:serine/threonine-protein kinase
MPSYPAAARTAPTVPADSVRAELDRVLASERFRTSERHRRLLQFVVGETLEGRASEIKETVLAIEVFGRDSSFDPRTDSVVRTEARNLRARLNEYYLGDGSADPVVIELPKGSYVPAFRAVPGEAVHRFPVVRWVALGLALAMVAGGLAWFLRQRTVVWPGSDPSIAVLPFLNLTDGASGEFAADGFVEDLTTGLAKLHGLRVVARTSAFQFRSGKMDVREIGRQLGVSAVLEGSLRIEKSGVTVTAQLIDAASGYHVWSERYSRDTADVQSMEADIQRSVARALGVRNAPQSRPAHVPPPEAREAYWRGRYVRANFRRHEESLRYFQQAVAADPQYADAWAALALTHAMMAFHLEGPVEQEVVETRAAARRALDLDETIPETQIALALAGYSFDHDWKTAERAFRRALELNPNYASGHRGYALLLTAQGRFDEASVQLNAAQQLDPVSTMTTNDLATNLYCARRYDEAIRVASRHLELDSTFFPARTVCGSSRLAEGKLPEAISDLEKAAAQGERRLMVLGPLGNALARSGRVAQARSVLAEIEAVQQTSGTAGVALAIVHTGLGDKKQAIEWLRRAADAHVTDVNFIGVDPVFDPLRNEPDFQALCARLGLPSGGAGR